MTIAWRPPQKRAKVKKILDNHDVHSSRCDVAATSILPLAKQQDDTALYWLMFTDPSYGPYLLPTGLDNTPTWYFHVCVAMEMHSVCALTGPDGYDADDYIRDKFQYADGVLKSEMDSEPALTKAIGKILGRDEG